jgi:hypothetical protein
MSTTLTVTGNNYDFPQTGDENWGDEVTDWATAVTNGMLQKSGGSFFLTAEVDFGATYGLKTSYYKSRGTNVASAGEVRLANTENIKWRNAANSADLGLSVNASNALQFNSLTLVDLSSAQTLTNKTVDVSANTFTNIANANVSASAAIDFSKLATLASGNILVGSAGNVATSVAVTGDVVISNAGVTAISSGVILNADINASAAIDFSKLATLTAGNVVLGNVSNVPTSTALTGDVTVNSSGVTAIASGVIVNADVNASAAIDFSKLATLSSGNILVGSAGNVATSTAVTGDVTISSSGVTAIGSSKVTNAMLAGSIAYSKLSLTGAILNADLAGSIAYSKLSLSNSILNADVNSAAAIAGTKISPDFGSQNVLTTGTGTFTSVSQTGNQITVDSDATGAQLVGLKSGSNTNQMYITANTVAGNGGEISLYGSSHATNANQIQFASNGNFVGTITSAGSWSIGLNTSSAHTLNTVVATSASAGANGAVPAQVAGYITININGTSRKIPYFAT